MLPTKKEVLNPRSKKGGEILTLGKRKGELFSRGRDEGRESPSPRGKKKKGGKAATEGSTTLLTPDGGK